MARVHGNWVPGEITGIFDGTFDNRYWVTYNRSSDGLSAVSLFEENDLMLDADGAGGECHCGSRSVKHPGHSEYCPRFRKVVV